jgi:hypothetical protein
MVLGPTQVFTKENVKARWMERYTSDAVNKKFLGLPRGVYLGFVPSPSGLTLTLKPDAALLLIAPVGLFTIGSTIIGGTSLATATIRVVTQGYVLVDNVVGTYLSGETVTAGPASATLGQYVVEDISFARVVTNNPLVAGRSEDMVDVITGDPFDLDFTGFPDGVYYVILTASYQVGQTTSATLITRTTPAPSGPTEVLVCITTKIGVALTVAAVAPASRHEPFAFEGTRIGYMPGGSYESLLAAAAAALEVIAARRLMDGTTATAFLSGSPQTTGLPLRLNTDLANTTMGRRLGKQSVTVQGNNFTLASPATSANVSGSFAARNRDFEPYKDQSPATGIAVPSGVPTSIAAGASGYVDLGVTGGSGTWTVGLMITGALSGATAIIKAVTGANPTPTLSVGDFVGSLFAAETISQSSPAAAGTIGTINLREGALTELSGAAATSPNIVTVIDMATGNKAFDVNTLVYGRLVYGPGGSGNPGELTLSGGQQLNFAAGSSTVVVGAGSIANPTEIGAGDIVEGADGRFYEAVTVTGNPITSFTLPVSKPYVGPTVTNSPSRRRRRFTLEFKKVVAGVETTATLPVGNYQFFFPCWFTLEKSNDDAAHKARGAGGQPGSVRVQNAGAASGSVVGAGATSSAEPIVNIIAGTNISLAVVEDTTTGKVSITITNTFVGGASFPGFGGVPPADSGAGGAGGLGTASRSDHFHPLSSAYTSRDGIAIASQTFPTGTDDMVTTISAPAVTPKLAIFVFKTNEIPPGNCNVGVAWGTGATEQAAINANTGSFQVGKVGRDINNLRDWTVTIFGATVTASINAPGANNVNGGACVVLCDKF